jgi:hypothetical protein
MKKERIKIFGFHDKRGRHEYLENKVNKFIEGIEVLDIQIVDIRSYETTMNSRYGETMVEGLVLVRYREE